MLTALVCGRVTQAVPEQNTESHPTVERTLAELPNMAIVLLCPKCAVRLTLDDDRGGTTFECPKCATAITVPVLLSPAPPTPPVPPPLPPPLELDEPEPEPDEGEDEPDDAALAVARARRMRDQRRRRARTVFFLRLGLFVFLCAVTVLLTRILVRRVSDPLSVESGRSLRGNERKIVGTWFKAEGIDNGRGMGGRIEVKTTYKADGTFQMIAIGLDISGTWLVQDEMLIEKVVKVTVSRDCPPEIAGLLEAAAVQRLKNTIHSSKIVSVSETHLITQDPATGQQSVAERVR